MKKILEEILKIIFIAVLAAFLFWTGELLIYAITVGRHQPKWKGYKDKTPTKKVLCEVGVGLTGFVLWIAAIPAVMKIIETAKAL
jgi:hypothetical protein